MLSSDFSNPGTAQIQYNGSTTKTFRISGYTSHSCSGGTHYVTLTIGKNGTAQTTFEEFDGIATSQGYFVSFLSLTNGDVVYVMAKVNSTDGTTIFQYLLDITET